MLEVEAILNEVEELRKHLNKFAEDKSKTFTDPEIISISKELDILLNSYHNLMKAKIQKLTK